MLTCITCSKQREEDSDEEAPQRDTKDSIKSLTSQIKDIALKVSGVQKGKSGAEEARFKAGQGSESTPAWNYSSDPHQSHVSESTSSQPLENEAKAKEWIAQVEPGVQITFMSLPQGGNDLKRIRFSRGMFDKWQAQRWWGENYDRIMELYNVQRFNQQALSTPGRSEDGRDSSYSRTGSIMESPAWNKCWNPRYTIPQEHVGSSYLPKGDAEASTSSRDEASASISNASEVEVEWIEEDEPGIYITIRKLIDGTRELRRVRFSRERFGEVDAKLWWETNRDRIQSQYLNL